MHGKCTGIHFLRRAIKKRGIIMVSENKFIRVTSAIKEKLLSIKKKRGLASFNITIKILLDESGEK